MVFALAGDSTTTSFTVSPYARVRKWEPSSGDVKPVPLLNGEIRRQDTFAMIVMAGCPDDLSRKRLYSLATDLAGEHAANGCRQLGHDITVDVRLGMRI